MNLISVYNTINSPLAVSTADGEKVYDLLNDSFNRGEKVVLDFQNIFLSTTAFLNVAIGKLYANKNYSSEFLNQHIVLKNISPEDVQQIKKVAERAKEFYKQPENIDRSANEALDD